MIFKRSDHNLSRRAYRRIAQASGTENYPTPEDDDILSKIDKELDRLYDASGIIAEVGQTEEPAMYHMNVGHLDVYASPLAILSFLEKIPSGLTQEALELEVLDNPDFDIPEGRDV